MKFERWLSMFLLCVAMPLSALEPEQLRQKLTKELVVSIGELQDSLLPGFYQAEIKGDLVHVSKDGRFLLTGDLLDLNTHENISEQYRQQRRVQKLSELPESSLIIYTPEDPKYVVNIFTDIDCGYCRKLHRQIDEYNDLGIKVRYLSFPRSGPNTESYFKAISVWCSKDKKSALTAAKNGKAIAKAECQHPIDEHLKIANELGVRATPWIVFESGAQLPGYYSPKDLLARLNAGH